MTFEELGLTTQIVPEPGILAGEFGYSGTVVIPPYKNTRENSIRHPDKEVGCASVTW